MSQVPAHFPSGLVSGHHGRVLDLLHEGVVGGGEGPAHPIESLAETTAADGEGEGRAEDGADLAERCADVLAEVGGQGERARAEMDAGRPEGVAGLQRVAPLYPPAAVQAATDVDAESADAWDHGRDILLVLVHDLGLRQVLAAAVRATGSQLSMRHRTLAPPA